ncbi:MAG: IPT/TIG domain-containing protein [Anaerolineae bacterium]
MRKIYYLVSVCLLATLFGLGISQNDVAQATELGAKPAALPNELLATDPEIVFINGSNGVNWIEGGGFFYLIDNCAIPSKQTATLRRLPIEGVSITTMQSINDEDLCNTYLSPAADESGIYYYNRDRGRIEHIPTDDPQSTPQVLANIGDWTRIGFGDGISKLMLTSSQIYWMDVTINGEFSPATVRFWKLAKEGGVPEMIHTYESMDANGVRYEGSALSGFNIIWTDFGGVHRLNLTCLVFPCTPYSPSTIQTQSIADGRMFRGDNGDVFWWDVDAEPNRVNRLVCTFFGCSSVEVFTTTTGAEIYSVNGTVDDYYWLEQVSGIGIRLQRKPRSGGATETLDETIGSVASFVDANYVYYSPMFNQIGRLPHDAEAIAREFSIAGWEVTQGIQNLENEVSLIAGKTTYVRVYPNLENGDSVNSLTAGLSGYRNEAELPGSPLYPINGSLSVNSGMSIADRGDLDNGFLFRLPESWVSEDDLLVPQLDTTIRLVAKIDPNGAYAGTDSAANNSISDNFTFIAKAPTCMSMRPVWTHEGTQFLHSYQVGQTVRISEALLPTANLIPIVKSDRLEEIDWCWKGPVYGPFCSDPYELSDDDSGLLTKMGWIDFWEDNPDVCVVNNARTLTAGIVHPDATWDWGGLARTGKDQFLTKVRPASDGAFNGFNGTSSTMAHEIGHSYNRKHIDCGSPKRPDTNYTYAPNTLDDGSLSDPDTHFGFNILREQPIIPNISGVNRGDLLSYCRVGVSDYTWEAIFERTQDPIFNPVRTSEIMADFLLIGGFVNITEGTGELDYGWTYPADDASAGLRKTWADALAQDWDRRAPDAIYHVRLIGKNDQILSDHTIELGSVDDDEHQDVSPFQFSVAAPTEAVVLMQLMADSVVLDSIEIGEGSPQVTVLKPAGGEAVNESLTIEWEATDPDNDALQYTVQYSYDEGQHWTPLLVNYPGAGIGSTESISVNIESEPGSAGQMAMIRVVASDGVNTALDTSNAFSVAPRAPQVVITNLADNQIFSPSEPLRLDGFVYDPEDLLLQKQNLIWTTGQFSMTGQINELVGLAPGQHTISLAGIDSDGLTNAFSRTIEIAPFHIVQATESHVLDGSCDDAGYDASTHLALTENPDGSRPTTWLTHDVGSMWVCTAGILKSNDLTKFYLDFSPSPQTKISSSSLVLTMKQDGTYTLERGNEAGQWVKQDVNDIQMRIVETDDVWSAEVKIARAVFGDWNRRVQLYMAQTEAGESPSVKWPLGGDGTDPQSWGATNLGLVSQLDGISPISTIVPISDVVVTIEGAGFTDANIVYFDGVEIDSGWVSTSVFSATIPAGLLQVAGSYSITVGVDEVDGLETSHQVFHALNRAPTVSGLTPNKVENGQSGLSVSVLGSNFLVDSEVMWGGTLIESTFVSQSEMQLSLTAEQLAVARIVGVIVINSEPGGGSSNRVEFEITSPFDPVGSDSKSIYLPFIGR